MLNRGFKTVDLKAVLQNPDTHQSSPDLVVIDENSTLFNECLLTIPEVCDEDGVILIDD